ncbi:SDR family oxidoreductase [Streptomyces sp. NPDC051776]|uniref:SDR family oxidoreductase n=1 Tax=Streptomyces sp. NPDC051776 TaxID=3155414 RepID=UPI003439A02E
MSRATLITGADGYLGRRVAAALLEACEDELILAVRAEHAGEFADKRARLAAELGPGARDRTAYVVADLRRDDPLSDVPQRTVGRIVHAAAVTRFNVEAEVAGSVNVEGTRRLCAFAARCESLERIALLSTLYTAGRRKGTVAEARHTDNGFVNHYEWSKWAAEEHAFSAGDLPLSVLRLPTVIADDDSGTVVQYNAFHNTVKLFFYGLLSLVPGDPSTPLSLATAAFTASAVTHLLDPAGPEGIYHLCPDPADTLTLGRLLDVVFDVFEQDPDYRRRHLPRPLPCDRDGFEDLVEAASRLRGGPIEESLASLAPFGTQLYLAKTFRNDALRAAWPGYEAPDPAGLAEAVTRHLVATRWGRRPSARRTEEAV